MNFPPAPLSMRARVSTVWSSSAHLIEIGIDKEFDSIVANFTENISTVGEFDVDAALHFKNPLSQLLDKILLSLPRLTKRSESEYACIVLSPPISLLVRVENKMVEIAKFLPFFCLDNLC